MRRERPQWTDVPAPVRASIERLIGDAVVHASSQPGGFSPGPAARLSTQGGRRVFVKAIDGNAWPDEVAAYRAEARVNTLLPADGIDPSTYGGPLGVDRDVVDAVLAAHAGFLLSGALAALPPALQALGAEKRRLGIAAVTWLQRRLTGRTPRHGSYG